ncbi:T9SS type A sorting domain-containing protein [Aureisphaera galaxeae]|uniref:VPS10 domain-containing protein n=1 Tax=Aureisphaera galaxeae TaxID=1538023 RepID=UPI00235056F6|nr:T9SS type A sorting domain-containing protein [Aureisphaera galaxeae]MDC8005447.1 T9SS type A sorting domain-containing protein [Aureisphaera galaxeae]
MEKKLLSLVYALLLSLGSLFAQNGDWQELGPFDWDPTTGWNPGIGRVTCVAVDPTNNDIMLVGTAASGVWKTIDGGGNWTPLNEDKLNKRVSSVAIDPSNPNTYYFSTNYSGLNKSEDGGDSWTWVPGVGMPLPSSINPIRKILVHPTNPEIIYVLIWGSLSGLEPGVHRTTNGGENWELILAEEDPYDITFKPGSDQVLYVSGTGFYRSPDGGTSWASIAGFNDRTKKIGVSIDDPDKVYVLQTKRSPTTNRFVFGGLFVSEDTGFNFTEIDHGNTNYFGYSTTGNDELGWAPRLMAIAVNPNNADEVHIAGILTWRSLDGGQSFTCTSDVEPNDAATANIGYCHKDVEMMQFAGNALVVCSDGGVYKAENTLDLNAEYYQDITTGMGIREVSSLAVSQSETPKVLTGSRHNGTSFYTTADGWKDWLGVEFRNDGVLIDKDDDNIFYGFVSYYGDFCRSDDGGQTFVSLPLPTNGTYYTETLQQDPVEPNTLYIAEDRVYKSTNKGESWTAISPDYHDVWNLEISPANNQIIYITTFSSFYRTLDGGNTWHGFSTPGSQFEIKKLALHPTNPNILGYVSQYFDEELVVRATYDGGATWENMKRNLPSLDGYSLVWDDNDNNGLYIGLKNGVYYTDDTRSDWVYFSDGLPSIPVTDLKINYVNNDLYAGTDGRGIWVSPVCGDCTLSNENVEDDSFLGIAIVPNPTKGIVSIRAEPNGLTGVEVLDVAGKIMYQSLNMNSRINFDLDISRFNAGVYFVRINTAFGTVTKRIIKE